jgi:hypothetical protein
MTTESDMGTHGAFEIYLIADLSVTYAKIR